MRCRRYVSRYVFSSCFAFPVFFFCDFYFILWVWKTPWIGVAHLLTADRRPIDPPPIVQLRVIDKARKNLPSPSPSPPPPSSHPQPASHTHAAQHTHESSTTLDTSMLTPTGFGAGPFLQNPYYFMFASLAKPDDDTELHWMKVRLCYRIHAPLFFSPSGLPASPPFIHIMLSPPGWQDAMYHGISRLVTLSPQGFRE